MIALILYSLFSLCAILWGGAYQFRKNYYRLIKTEWSLDPEQIVLCYECEVTFPGSAISKCQNCGRTTREPKDCVGRISYKIDTYVKVTSFYGGLIKRKGAPIEVIVGRSFLFDTWSNSKNIIPKNINPERYEKLPKDLKNFVIAQYEKM